MMTAQIHPSEPKSSCSLPMGGDSVCVKDWRPVARWARPPPAGILLMPGDLIQTGAHLISPARIPEDPIPSVNSRAKNLGDLIHRTLSEIHRMPSRLV